MRGKISPKECSKGRELKAACDATATTSNTNQQSIEINSHATVTRESVRGQRPRMTGQTNPKRKVPKEEI
jgi:hypothetical protein